MKRRLSIVFGGLLLVTVIVVLEIQLRYTRMEFQATTAVTDELYFAFFYANHHPRESVHSTSEEKTNR